MKKRMSETDKQEDIKISVEYLKTIIRKMTNWKASGPDLSQRYFFKKFSTLHSRLHLQICILAGNVPTWTTKGKTTLIQKDPKKENATNKYHPIACLPLMWKLQASVLGEKVYPHLSEKNLRPDEQEGCRNAGKTHEEQRAKS